jgi:hypothetical protein
MPETSGNGATPAIGKASCRVADHASIEAEAFAFDSAPVPAHIRRKKR